MIIWRYARFERDRCFSAKRLDPTMYSTLWLVMNHYNPETKEQSKVCVEKWSMANQSSSGQEFRQTNGDDFLYDSGLIKYIMLEPGATINVSWYANTCLPLKSSKTYSNREQFTLFKISCFMTIITRPHRTWITSKVLSENYVESYINPPYSSDLSPYDIFLFPKLKN
jgi:hypothetical protein